MYTPLLLGTYTPGINADVWLLGITFVEISAISAAIEIIVTVLKLRAPGMSLDRMPIFAWYMLVTAVMMLIGFPPLILGLDPARARAGLRPAVLRPDARRRPAALAAPVLAVRPPGGLHHLPARRGRGLDDHADLRPARADRLPDRRRRGHRHGFPVASASGCTTCSPWAFPHLALAFFSAASALVAIPTAVQIFAWIATLAAGRPALDVPMLYLVGFFVVFVIGGLTGVMLAMVPFNWPGPRHPLRRRASALRAGRRLRLPDAGRRLLLAAALHRARLSAPAVGAGLLADLRRLQPHLLR